MVISHESLNSVFCLTATFMSFKMATMQLSVGTGHLNLVTIYQPPHSPGFFAEFQDIPDESVTWPIGLVICDDMNCPSKAGIIDPQIQCIDDTDMCQHTKEYTNIKEGTLDLIITMLLNPKVSSIRGVVFCISDHSIITAPIDKSRPQAACQMFEARNFKKLEMNKFRSRLSAYNVFNGAKTNVND